MNVGMWIGLIALVIAVVALLWTQGAAEQAQWHQCGSMTSAGYSLVAFVEIVAAGLGAIVFFVSLAVHLWR